MLHNFWTTKATVIHTEPGKEFSFWLLIAMALVGLLCFYLEKWLVHFAWRTFG